MATETEDVVVLRTWRVFTRDGANELESAPTQPWKTVAAADAVARMRDLLATLAAEDAQYDAVRARALEP